MGREHRRALGPVRRHARVLHFLRRPEYRADLPAVELLRISPQAAYTGEIVAAFADRLAGREAAADFAGWNPEGLVNGYWRAQAGIAKEMA